MNKYDIARLAAAVSLAFSTGAIAQGMTKTEYKNAKEVITTEFKSARLGCVPMSGNAKDICMAEATGKQKVAMAELDSRRAPGAKRTYDLGIARASADYSVAKEKCDDMTGDAKKTCVTDAKAVQAKARSDAKAEMMAATASDKPAVKTAAAPASKQEGPVEYVEDSVITTKVKAAVFEEPSLKSTEINVETYKGIVQLSGFVRSRADINKAVEVARKVKGVASVKNVMIVKGQQ